MGKSGPRPLPKAIRAIRGTENRHPRPWEPDEISGDMEKPECLEGYAAEKWDQLMAILRARNTVSPAYVDFVFQYCMAWQEWFNAVETLKAEGNYVTSANGGVYQHPAMGVKNRSIDIILKIGREFGLSPTSIRDVQANDKPKENEKAKFFVA